MSSLRLALKLSMEGTEEPKKDAPKPAAPKPIPRRKRSNSDIAIDEGKGLKKGIAKDESDGEMECSNVSDADIKSRRADVKVAKYIEPSGDDTLKRTPIKKPLPTRVDKEKETEKEKDSRRSKSVVGGTVVHEKDGREQPTAKKARTGTSEGLVDVSLMSMSTKKVIVDGDDNSRGRVHSDAVENQKKTTEGREEARRRVSSQQESGVLVAEKSEDRSVCDIADLPAVKKEGDVPPPPPIQKPSEQTLVKVESEELRGDPGSGEKLTSPPQTDNAEVDNGGIIDEAYKIEPEVVDDEMGECEDDDEPKATGRKPRGRRKRAGGIELDEEILQQQQMKGEGSGEEDGDDEGDGAPRYQSSRAAAMIAKSRLSVSGSTKSRGAAIGADTAEEAVESLDKKPTAPLPKQWVCCDTCGKWRSIPGEVDTSNLPEQWHCSLNEWDEGHNDCSHEEEEYVEEPEPVTADVTSQRGDGDAGRGRGGRGRAGRGGRRGRRPLNREAVVDPVGAKGGDDEVVGVSVQGRKRRGRIPYGATSADDEADNDVQQMSIAVPVVENVTWVQCNKCSKWRKVPGRINQKDLPDVWYCVMNTWAPEYARCSAKEEVEEVLPAAVGPVGRGAGVGRGRYVRRGRTDDGGAAPVAANGVPPKKVTQWVQCERKNCKKWRKIPGHVDMATLPDRWYCEMNLWDPERATCDGAEESDSEGEQPAHAATRTQLILGNSKGPGTLSYRRLIFGTDGRIRPSYSEKNKNGYGMFSFTEVFRPSDADEYIMPTRRVGYWWSSQYDETGVNYKTHSKAHRVDKKANHVSDTHSDSTPVPTGIAATKNSFLRPFKRYPLMDTIGRLVQSGSASGTPRCVLSGVDTREPAAYGKWGKVMKRSQKQTLQQRIRLACDVVRSCLMVQAAEEGPTMHELMQDIYSTHFLDDEMEACRSTLGVDELRETLYRLEASGDVEVLYDNDGDLSFRLLLQMPKEKSAPNPYPEILSSSELSMDGMSLPLNMRKRKLRIGPPLPPAPYMSVASAVAQADASLAEVRDGDKTVVSADPADEDAGHDDEEEAGGGLMDRTVAEAEADVEEMIEAAEDQLTGTTDMPVECEPSAAEVRCGVGVDELDALSTCKPGGVAPTSPDGREDAAIEGMEEAVEEGVGSCDGSTEPLPDIRIPMEE